MICKGNRRATLYRGDYKPAALYRGANRVAGWTEETKAAPASWENTYNDFFRVTALGCGKQDGTPTPEAPVEMVASSGTLRACGKNLYYPSRKPDCTSGTEAVISSDWLTVEVLGNASATKPGQSVASSGWIALRFPPLAPGMTYTVSLDIEVLEGSNADFVSPRRVLLLQNGAAKDAVHNIAENTSQHTVFSYTPTERYGAFDGIIISANSQHIRVSNVMIRAGAVEDAPYEKGIAGSSVELPALRQIPGTEVRDEAAYIGGGQWKITRHVGEIMLTALQSVSPYAYNGLKGVGISKVLAANASRIAGICSHESRVGKFYASTGHYMWLGVGDSSVYWIGILDALGLTTVDEFKAWLEAQAAAGTPVTIWYQLAAPTAETLNLGELKTYPRFASLAAGSDYPPEITATAKVSE